MGFAVSLRRPVIVVMEENEGLDGPSAHGYKHALPKHDGTLSFRLTVSFLNDSVGSDRLVLG